MNKENHIKSDIYISGKKVFLRSLKKKDALGNWWKWLNNKNVTKYMAKGTQRNTAAKQVEFFEEINLSKTDIALAICDMKSRSHVGTTALHKIDWAKGSAQFGIIIGEEDYWGQGIGTEAWFLLTDYAFSVLKLKTIYTKIFKDNLPSLKIAEKCGFREKVFLPEDVSKNGCFFDRYLLQLTKYKWDQVKVKKNL